MDLNRLPMRFPAARRAAWARALVLIPAAATAQIPPPWRRSKPTLPPEQWPAPAYHPAHPRDARSGHGLRAAAAEAPAS
jgi:hypothetical protein